MGLESAPVDVFNKRIAAGDFDVLLMEMSSGTSVNRPFSFWHSKAIHGFSGYDNRAVDAALEDIGRAVDDNAYKQGFHRFQQATFDDPPAIFLAWGEIARAVSRRFEVVKAPSGDIRMTISDWKLASKAAN
jgi:ABC-type transport system substrate-binding protein